MAVTGSISKLGGHAGVRGNQTRRSGSVGMSPVVTLGSVGVVVVAAAALPTL